MAEWAEGGGSQSTGGGTKCKKCEYYERDKNKWIILPETNEGHPETPILWMDNKYQLNISSN